MRRTLSIKCIYVYLAMAAFAVAGSVGLSCGEEEIATAPAQDTPNTATNVIIERPAEGTVRVLDALEDTIDKSGGQVQAPPWVDITTLTIIRDERGYKFVMDLAGELPEQVVEGGIGSQWVFNLDTNGDGERDWSVTAALTTGGWQVLLFDHETSASLSNAEFPGSFIHPGSSIEWELDPATIGSPESLRWSALAEEVAIAQDVVPQDGWPRGEGWLDFP